MTTSPRRGARPGLRFLMSHPAHFVALGFGAGLSPWGPGSLGTLVAFPLHAMLKPALPGWSYLGALAGFFLAGVALCARTGHDLGVEDHPGMVWDEIVAFLAVLAFTPPGLGWQLGAFALFRYFDIAKPGPVRWAERRFRGGLGVMIDDAVAAFLALLCLTLIKLGLDNYGGM